MSCSAFWSWEASLACVSVVCCQMYVIMLHSFNSFSSPSWTLSLIIPSSFAHHRSQPMFFKNFQVPIDSNIKTICSIFIYVIFFIHLLTSSMIVRRCHRFQDQARMRRCYRWNSLLLTDEFVRLSISRTTINEPLTMKILQKEKRPLLDVPFMFSLQNSLLKSKRVSPQWHMSRTALAVSDDRVARHVSLLVHSRNVFLQSTIFSVMTLGANCVHNGCHARRVTGVRIHMRRFSSSAPSSFPIYYLFNILPQIFL